MNLVAALVVRNELGRYLDPCIAHLRAFCDRIVVLDDASDDGTSEWLDDRADEQLMVRHQGRSSFYRHEGQTRTLLLQLTLEQQPTHVLPLDADEFLTDGVQLRGLIATQQNVDAWRVAIEEVWEADHDGYRVREDGAWAAGRTVVWRTPGLARMSFPNRALACGRVPMQIRSRSGEPSDVSLLHVGWLDPAARLGRAERYRKHDGGRYHASAHLASILWPPEKVTLADRTWPSGFDRWRDAIAASLPAAA